MKTLDRSTAGEISKDVMEALKAVALKHGVQFTQKGGSFSPTSLTLRIEAAVIGDGGVAETRERKAFSMWAGNYQLKPEWLDQTFASGTHTYKITGLATRKSKNPILCQRLDDNKTYIFPADIVKLRMEAQTKTPTTVAA